MEKPVKYNDGGLSEQFKHQKHEELARARRELEELVDLRLAENDSWNLAGSEAIVEKSQQVDRLLNELYSYTIPQKKTDPDNP